MSQQSGHSSAKLYRIVDYWLARKPEYSHSSLEKHQYTLFDGTFLHRPECIVALMDADQNTIISGEYGVSESSEPQLLTFLQPLKEQKLSPISCTVDGNPHAIRVLKQLWPDIIIQRCLVHIQRQGLSWCRQYPKRTDAKKLRELFLKVTHISDQKQRNQFLESVDQWEKRYGHKIASQPEKGWVFSDLKRARSMLLKALSNMFHYLEDPEIPKTTNGLEGYFSRMKRLYRNHNGLHNSKLKNYFEWHFYLTPK